MTRRFRNVDWFANDKTKNIETWERVGIAVLIDIREELQTLNALLRCPNFLSIPARLETIARNTRKPRKKVKPA
jgi:hypothetical protein